MPDPSRKGAADIRREPFDRASPFLADEIQVFDPFDDPAFMIIEGDHIRPRTVVTVVQPGPSTRRLYDRRRAVRVIAQEEIRILHENDESTRVY